MAEEEVRLLACVVCKTIEELPDFKGRPEQDHLLNRLLEGHGPEENRHIGQLFRVEKSKWDSPKVKTEVANQIAAALKGGETGLGSEFYNIKNTFVEDAGACFKAHHRNPACHDSKSDSKKLTPNTKAERKAAGIDPYESAHDRYLCEYCPVHSLVMTARRKKAGLYDG
jgi:hypothetical protein